MERLRSSVETRRRNRSSIGKEPGVLVSISQEE